MTVSVYAHIVTYNSASVHGEDTLRQSIEALLNQERFIAGESLFIQLSDNASSDSTPGILKEFESRQGVSVENLRDNLGFCAAHNAAAHTFLASSAEYFFIVNPDLALEPDALLHLVEALKKDSIAGSACPRLLQVSSSETQTIDSSGMLVTPALRHFDRGQGEKDGEIYSSDCYVFGGSGACLLMKRSYIEAVSFRAPYDDDLFLVYPQLKPGYEERFPLFDEAFFAYRDDAELAWRSQYLGWSCRYVASARGFHHRRVTPDKRGTLPREINLLGVQNRFLLQRNCYRFLDIPAAFLPGFIVRNLLVVLGVLFIERESIQGLRQFKSLYRRSRARYTFLMKKKVSNHNIRRWFSSKPYVEPV